MYNEEFIIESLIYFKPTKSDKDDILVKQMDYMEEIIFIISGKINLESFIKISEIHTCKVYIRIIKKDFMESKKILQLRKNEFYGNYLMVENLKSAFNMKTDSKISELYLISRDDVINLSSSYPEIFEIIHPNSQRNTQFMNDLIKAKKDKISKEVKYVKE